ncbi:type VI secretion system secreted protein Hcp [Devosia sp. UYZn731]|uniref:Hcp family type VI secretion system effector n=1 Tax=Devosia sp. UYZn731 TaxID=3156345 RepID=UPI00339AEFD0
MSGDYFLKIDGIKGESKDDKHPDEIEIDSFSIGVTNAGAMSAGGGGGAGKASFSDFHFSKTVDKSSPELMLACANGKHFAKAVVVLRKSGEDKLEYNTVTMSDVVVSSYQSSGHGGNGVLPTDSVSLNYAKIEYAYIEQDNKGKAKGTVTTSWNVKSNTK